MEELNQPQQLTKRERRELKKQLKQEAREKRESQKQIKKIRFHFNYVLIQVVQPLEYLKIIVC